jgi:hypothetical protein
LEELHWGARASRTRYSASGRIQRPPSGFTFWWDVLCRRASRRDADWSDRDGRAPHMRLSRFGFRQFFRVQYYLLNPLNTCTVPSYHQRSAVSTLTRPVSKGMPAISTATLPKNMMTAENKYP